MALGHDMPRLPEGAPHLPPRPAKSQAPTPSPLYPGERAGVRGARLLSPRSDHAALSPSRGAAAECSPRQAQRSRGYVCPGYAWPRDEPNGWRRGRGFSGPLSPPREGEATWRRAAELRNRLSHFPLTPTLSRKGRGSNTAHFCNPPTGHPVQCQRPPAGAPAGERPCPIEGPPQGGRHAPPPGLRLHAGRAARRDRRHRHPHRPAHAVPERGAGGGESGEVPGQPPLAAPGRHHARPGAPGVHARGGISSRGTWVCFPPRRA